MTREEAIEILEEDAYLLYKDDSPYNRQAYKMAIEALEQEPKIGHWEKSRDCFGNNHFICSECGNDIATQYEGDWDDNYCSVCGAKMQAESEG